MGQVLSVVLPVFGLIGIGAAVAWTKLLGRTTGDALSEFVFAVAIPLLIFRIMATADLGKLADLRSRLASVAEAGEKSLVFSQFVEEPFGVRRLAHELAEYAPLPIYRRYGPIDACFSPRRI